MFGCLSEFAASIFQGVFEGEYPRHKSFGRGVWCMELEYFMYSVDSIRLFICGFSRESRFLWGCSRKNKIEKRLCVLSETPLRLEENSLTFCLKRFDVWG